MQQGEWSWVSRKWTPAVVRVEDPAHELGNRLVLAPMGCVPEVGDWVELTERSGSCCEWVAHDPRLVRADPPDYPPRSERRR